MSDTVKCPACLKDNDLEKLEQYTEYGCWSGEEVGVNCMECEHHFEVRCEHSGYAPSCDNFDLNGFFKFHKIKVPDNFNHTWTRYYFEDLVINGHTKMVVPESPYESQREGCKNSYEFAIKEWKRIKEDLESK